MLAVVLVLAVAGWAFMFLPDPDGVWPRTWVVAFVLGAAAVGGLVLDGRIRTVVGPVSFVDVGLGIGVGVGWLMATHVGHRVICRLFPTFMDRVNALYALRDHGSILPVVGPLVAMGITEELVFRGYVQGRIGVVAAVIAYAAVQLVVRNWALVLAAVLCGAVWGTLAWWRDGLLAAVVAHVLWTGALTFIWPLSGCAGKLGPEDIDRLEALAPEATP